MSEKNPTNGDVFEVHERHRVIGVKGSEVITIREDADDSTVYRWARPLDEREGITFDDVDTGINVDVEVADE